MRLWKHAHSNGLSSFDLVLCIHLLHLFIWSMLLLYLPRSWLCTRNSILWHWWTLTYVPNSSVKISTNLIIPLDVTTCQQTSLIKFFKIFIHWELEDRFIPQKHRENTQKNCIFYVNLGTKWHSIWNYWWHLILFLYIFE